MNRILNFVAALSGVALPMFFDSAWKGVVLLAVAVPAVLAMRRASAAARHMVWLAALAALLLLPVLSICLPQWRVLPGGAWWTGAQDELPAAAPDAGREFEELPPVAELISFDPAPALPIAPAPRATATAKVDLPAPKPAAPAGEATVFTWRDWLPAVWLAGFALCGLRLTAAHFLLRRAGARGREVLDGPLREALDRARAQLGVRRTVRLFLDESRSIPVVWGVFRTRLLLPAEARRWDDGQLRSVLLHELAHVKRHDTVGQWLAQVACALHWFNPLAWLAAWRLHVERERACDDLVLASGVRPSAYATHLLHVATTLSHGRWTTAGGLTMARKSRLEGRLLAVLSDRLNRRGVSVALAAATLVSGAGLALPLAMLRAANEAWQPPDITFVGSDNFSTYCIYSGEETAFVLFYPGDIDSETANESNPETKSWTNAGTLTAKKPGIAFSFQRDHTAPDSLTIASAPAAGRDLSAPAPPPRAYGQRVYNLVDGRVFLLGEDGSVRQLGIPAPVIRDLETARQLRETIAAHPPQSNEDIEPKNEYARAHFARWQKYARANGDIPGGLIAMLDASVGGVTDPKLQELRKRLDGTRDWPASEAAALLDAIAATDNWLDDGGLLSTLENYDIVRTGTPLPPELASLPWGTPDEEINGVAGSDTGLRAAFAFEPDDDTFALGSQLPVTIHYHNSGDAPLVFSLGPRYMDMAEAHDEQGRRVFAQWTLGALHSGRVSDPPMGNRHAVRLEPGHWISVTGSLLTLAPGHFADTPDSKGMVMLPRAGSTIRVRWIAATATWAEGYRRKPMEWNERVARCIERLSPMPESRADRERLLRRVTFALTGEEATEADVAAFAADDSSDALAKLTARFQAVPPLARFGGWLKTGERSIRVAPGPVEYRGTVMTAHGSGLYELTDSVFLHHFGGHANFEFTPPAPEPHPRTIELRDKENNMLPHGLVWRHGSGVLWLAEKERVRKFDFSVPGKLTETELPAGLASVPDELRAELVKAFPAVETAASAPPGPPGDKPPPEPKHESAQALFAKWQERARTDGTIPGALIGQVANQVDQYLEQYPDTGESQKLEELRSRLDATRDWTPAEAAALLDEIAAIATAPVSWAELPMNFDSFRTIRPGRPLPDDLVDAAWGEPAANGLRAAWLLEPQADEYPVGTVLKARVLFYNAGDAPVIFRTETRHQSDVHTARDAQGAEIAIKGTFYTGITPIAVYRLLPGEYCEGTGHGIAIGAGEYKDEFSTGRVGAIVEAKAGDVVSFSHTVDVAQGIRFSRPGDPEDPEALWRKRVADRIASEAPLPQSPADREQLIRRVTLDLTGEPPADEEIERFVNDSDPAALDALSARLQAMPPVEPWTGRLPTGVTTFRVTAADPDAANAPRSANAPGRYVLGENVHLQVTQTTSDSRRENKATIVFLANDPKVASPFPPYEIALPDGRGSYGIVWERGAGELWIMESGLVRRYSFANPAQVQETRIEQGSIADIPAPLQDAMKKAFSIAVVPEPQRNTPPPGGGAKLSAALEAQLDWGEAVNGLRGALIVRSPGEGKPQGIFLAVQNVSNAPLRFADTTNAEKLRTLFVNVSGKTQFALTSGEATLTDVTLQPGEAVYLPIMPGTDGEEESPAATMIEGLRRDSLQTWRAVLAIETAPDAAWTGTLTTGETRGTASEGGPQPQHPKGQALFKLWQDSARLNGDIPGGLLRLLHDKVSEFIRNNEADASGSPYAAKMKPLEARFARIGDWKPAEVVTLLDDIAAAHEIPLETTLEYIERHTLRSGLPLPASLNDADWGAPLASGLRMAYVLEPRANSYHLGTEIKARILLHNSGAEPVAFVTTGFQQPKHRATLAGGSDLALDSIEWLTRGRVQAYRLAPGEYCEISTPGLGIGARNPERDDWANVRAGTWIRCSEGDNVIFTPGAAMLFDDAGGGSDENWWPEFVVERLAREAPVPDDEEERERLLYRVVRELYGVAPSTAEGEAFAADRSPDALKNLAALLAKHSYGTQSHGIIRAGTTTFRVLPPDADASTRPRVANAPGWYSLSDNVRFSVVRRADGAHAVNEASIVYLRQGRDNVVHRIPLPDGYSTWAAGMRKGTTELWVSQNGLLRKFDFADPLKVGETRYESDDAAAAPIPADVREAMRTALGTPGVDSEEQKPPPPAAPATETSNNAALKLTPEALIGVWRGMAEDRKLAISFHRPPAEDDVLCDIYIGDATVGVPARIEPDGRSVILMRSSAEGPVRFGRLVARPDGTLMVSEEDKPELDGGFAGVVFKRDAEQPSTEPRQAAARELFSLWKSTANADGTIPGTFIGKLATEVRAFVKENPNLDSGLNLPKLLPRFVTSRNWQVAEVIQLLDDVAYYSTAPIEAYVAKAKLPSGPLWRTMVEFQDIPVRIDRWSEPVNGLRLGMRVVEGDWRIGGRVRLEMWLHNVSSDDVTFRSTGPDRQDAGISVSAVGADGREHRAEHANVFIVALPMECTLPAGHVAMAKRFDVTFEAPDSGKATWNSPGFRDLKPGDYQLRCRWVDANPAVSGAGDWTGDLAAPDVEFTLAKAPAPAAPAGISGSAGAESVFLSRESKRPFGVVDFGDGVTLAIDERVFHGADVMTTARIRYSADDGTVTGHDEGIAADAFGNRERWAIGWVKGSRMFWHVSTGIDGRRLTLYRVDFGNPQRIVSDYLSLYPNEPISGLGMPDSLRRQFEEFCGIENAVTKDKSGRLPEVGGQFLHGARKPDAGGRVPLEAFDRGEAGDWKVTFVDSATGDRVSGIRVRVTVRSADGTRSGWGVRRVDDASPLELTMGSDEFATVESVDNEWLGGGADGFAIGNVPPEFPAVVRHTDSATPFAMNVWRGDKVAGRVLMPDGSAAADVSVRVGVYVANADWKSRLGMENVFHSWDHGDWPNWVRVVATDADGNFEATVPPKEAASYLRIACEAPGAAPFEMNLRATNALPSLRNPSSQDPSRLVVQLEAGVRLHGRVLDPDGRPVPRAEVILSDPRGPYAGPRALTNGDGEYELRAAPGGTSVTIDTRPRDSQGQLTGRDPRVAFPPEPLTIPDNAADLAKDFRAPAE